MRTTEGLQSLRAFIVVAVVNDFSANMQETQTVDNYTSWYNSNYGITGIGEEPASLFDMFNLYPVSDLGSPLEEMAYQVENKTQWKNDCRFWLSEYDPCCGGYWVDDLFSCGRYSKDDDDGCNDPVVRTEDSSQSEEQYQSYAGYFEDDFSQPDCVYNPLSYHQYCEDEDSYNYEGDEPRTTDEVELWGTILWYFPFLLRERKEYTQLLNY